ncbi:MAG: DUF4432 family protein [Actinobacteria bacterium]|nr:MAG: DUF4432 family protein [Actinomycetota bacterium]
MRIYERELSRREVMRRVGNLQQIGGIEHVAYQDGHARGVRALQVNTGAGLRFSVTPDRGMDVGRADFAGIGLCYLAPNPSPGPWYYEGKLDDYAWLRVGLGGLFNTAGLVTIGVPQTISTEQYGFTQRLTERYGTHGRVAVTPASRYTYGERWDGDTCRLWVEGLVREEISYGENLSLARRYETELGSTAFRMVDVVTNDGWFPTPHQLLYHVNIGYPIVDDGAEVLASVTEEPADMSFTTGGSEESTSRWRTATDPVSGFTHEGYVVSMRADADGKVAVAVVNRRLRPEVGGLGVYLRYDARQFPAYIAWRMMREGLYAIGMEPSTNPFGELDELLAQGYALMLEPGESRTYETEFGILDGADAIDAFAAALPS